MSQNTPPREGWKIGLSLVLVLWVFLALVLAGNAMAHPPHPPKTLPPQAVSSTAEAEQLTQSLAALSARYRGAAAAEQARLQREMLELAEARHQWLTALMEERPGEVLRLALPDSIRARMPSFVQAFLEQREAREGDLEVLHIDARDPEQSRYQYFLETPRGERLSLHFAANPPRSFERNPGPG